MKVDLVYLWVDGSDKKWLARKNAALVKAGKLPVEATGRFRFDDNDELLFSLRSARRFAPWINHIFIVTGKQTPKWLNLKNPKVTIVDENKIMPASSLPKYSSTSIEFYIPRIPNLSEHFIYANDDMLFMAKTKPSYFFNRRGIPILRVNDKKGVKNYLRNLLTSRERQKNLSIYDINKLNSYELARGEVGDVGLWDSAHNIDPYRKSDMLDILKLQSVQQKMKVMERIHFRDPREIHRIIFHLLGIARFRYKKVGRRWPVRVWQFLTLRFRDQPLYTENIAKAMSKKLFHRKLVCVEDPTNPKIRKSNHDYLLRMFPKKSEFEK